MEKLKGIISGIPYDSVTEKDLILREPKLPNSSVFTGFTDESICVHGRILLDRTRMDIF